MTATASETAADTALNIAVDVRFTLAGTPLAVRYEGRIWAVAADPVQWFGPVGRGDGVPTAGSDTPGAEYWRLQVRLGSTSAVRIFTLRRDHPASQWLLESICRG